MLPELPPTYINLDGSVSLAQLTCWLVGEEIPLSLLISLSSISLPSINNELLLTLGSELAVLLVARGESQTLKVLLFVDPDLTLYMEEAGTFVISGR